MRALFYSTQKFERVFLKNEEDRISEQEKIEGKTEKNQFDYTDHALSMDSVECAKGYDAISIFAGDDASEPVIERLAQLGVKKIAIRAAGYDNVDLKKAKELGFQVANVPDYSPYAIAEHTIALMLNLARKIKIAERQVKEHDFRTDNLVGFELHKKTVGIIGTGRIGSIVAKILNGFGAKIIAYDLIENEELKKEAIIQYVSLNQLIKQSDIITIHTGLHPNTRHLINEERIEQMKDGVMIINTDRGACMDTKAVIEALRTKKIGYFGADVYEYEKGIFFHDLRTEKLKDEMLDELMKMDNVILTPHEAFATNEALTNIAIETFKSLNNWGERISPKNILIN